MAGIYIHIPFCKKACKYCNFHFSTTLHLKDGFIEALLKEIELFQGGPETIKTIYFGGGTPSLIEPPALRRVLELIQEKFIVEKNAEITLETNPDDIGKEKLTEWYAMGINRLSVGIQSFLEEELVWMNRAHNARQSLESLQRIKESPFKNYSVDLIYGSPLLNDADWAKNIDRVLELGVPHISSYALTVEPKTLLDWEIRKKQQANVDTERQSAQFTLLMNRMKEAGYIHYEISNFSLPGMESIHNSSYWKGEVYYGFGPSAHAFDGKRTRSWNIANTALYIQSLKNNSVPAEYEVLSEIQQLNEMIMISLRTREGLDLDKVRSAFGEDYVTSIMEKSQPWISNLFLVRQHSALILSNTGKLFADKISVELFF